MKKKPGPKPTARPRTEHSWMVNRFPDQLKAQLKYAAQDHHMTLREYVIMALKERLTTERGQP